MAKGKRKSSVAPSDGPSTSKKAKSAVQNESTKSTRRTVVVKGCAGIDEYCPVKDTTHVYSDTSGPYDAMLNQTNISRNNNKFYILQLLEHDAGKKYSVWFRWGRVGNKGQNSLTDFGANLDGAKNCFTSKFHDKTRNDWADRKNFEKVDGKYDLIQLDHSAKPDENNGTENGENKVADAKTDSPIKSKLVPHPDSVKSHGKCQMACKVSKVIVWECPQEARVKELLELICDVNAMREAMVELQYDADKLPLGKLTPAQIKAGFCALKTIEQLIEKGSKNRSKLMDACNEYYTRIPHVFGMRTPPLINTVDQLKLEIQLCEALSDVEVAMRTLRDSTLGDKNKLHPADRCYAAMKCDLKALKCDDRDFVAICDSVKGTHGPTHLSYKLKVLNVFTAARHCELNDEKFDKFDNRRLLWHGSRLANWYGIVCEGLRVAPPHVPITGHMFGRGIYFADVCTKSANYCFANQNNNTAMLALCEVALGNPKELTAADYNADKLHKGFHSTKGLGIFVPDPKGDEKLGNDAILSTGPLVKSDVHNKNGYTLQYNEYIVYSVEQVRLRYLVQVKFEF